MIIMFSDRGKPSDPRGGCDPNTRLPLKKRPIGGLGIYMLKKSMDDVHYENRDGQNMLTIRKVF